MEDVKGWCLVPPNILGDKRLTPNAKLLYGIVLGLVNRTGYCWAGNEYFSKIIGVDERSVQRHLRLLKKLGYFTIELDGEQRRITTNVAVVDDKIVAGGGDKNVTHICIHKETPVTTPVTEVKDTEVSLKKRKSSANDAKDLTKALKKAKTQKEAKDREHGIDEVFSFWRKARERVMKQRGLWKEHVRTPRITPQQRKHINARLKEGYSVDDLKHAVIGCLSNSYNVDRGFIDLNLIFRNQSKCDQYITWYFKHEREIRQQPKEWIG